MGERILNVSNLLTYSKEMFEIYTKHQVSRSAAELSYFITLSIFPTIICIYAAFGSFIPHIMGFIVEMESILPSETVTTIMDYLTYISSRYDTAMLTAGIIGMATTSAAAFRSLHHIMANIQGAARFKGIFALLFSFLFSLIFLASIYFAIIVIVTGGWLINILSEILPIFAALKSWGFIRYPLMLLVFICIIYALYRITAPSDVKDTFFPGAVTAAIVLVAVSAIFSWFIGMATNYPLIYGSLATIIVFMLWIYTCGTIFIMGNALNIVLRRSRS